MKVCSGKFEFSHWVMGRHRTIGQRGVNWVSDFYGRFASEPKHADCKLNRPCVALLEYLRMFPRILLTSNTILAISTRIAPHN